MDDVQRARLDDDLMELVGFMVTSARGLMDEPPHYGPFRLVDAADRLVTVLERSDLSTEALTQLRARIEQGKETSMGTLEEFRAFLDELVLALVDDD